MGLRFSPHPPAALAQWVRMCECDSQLLCPELGTFRVSFRLPRGVIGRAAASAVPLAHFHLPCHFSWGHFLHKSAAPEVSSRLTTA